jgi:serine protease Do
LRQQLGLAKDTGLVLDKVSDSSAAGKAGLKTYDILVQFDGKAVPSDVAGFRKVLAAAAPGSSVDVVVVRQGKQETVKGLTLPAGAK